MLCLKIQVSIHSVKMEQSNNRIPQIKRIPLLPSSIAPLQLASLELLLSSYVLWCFYVRMILLPHMSLCTGYKLSLTNSWYVQFLMLLLCSRIKEVRVFISLPVKYLSILHHHWQYKPYLTEGCGGQRAVVDRGLVIN